MMQNDSNVPFLDLITPHLELEDELISIFRTALRSASFIGGPMVDSFEEDFARFCGTKYCVGVNSGTDALRFALMAAGIQKGDIVITVPNTFIATTEAITQAGLLIDFVDVDERTYNMDPEKLREYLETSCDIDQTTGKPINLRTGRTVSGIIPVHLYGQMAHMDPILDLANKYHLMVIEDACQAHGAEYFSKREQLWKKAGSLGLAGAFSFYPGKNLGACGEAGAITTNDSEVARISRMLRDHGQSQKYYHAIEGYNGRLDAIQAGILSVKLKHLPQWNEKRRQNARYYTESLSQVEDIVGPYEPQEVKSIYHLYVIRSECRDDLQRYLSANAIATALHYPLPLHLQASYLLLGFTEGAFPISEKMAGEIISLPMYPQLNNQLQDRVISKVSEFFSHKSSVQKN
jgi:dTDP-4-amino-4,6-dideoxygalactose transaminase